MDPYNPGVCFLPVNAETGFLFPDSACSRVVAAHLRLKGFCRFTRQKKNDAYIYALEIAPFSLAELLVPQSKGNNALLMCCIPTHYNHIFANQLTFISLS